MKNLCSVKTWKTFKKSGLVNCGYFEFAVWIPFVIWTEWLIWRLTGEDFHWSDLKSN
jgi:hypothetical protein